MDRSSDARDSRPRPRWRVGDYALIGFLGGLTLTLVEAIDRTIVLAPFFSTPAQRVLWLVYLSPTLLGATLIGALIGIGFEALRALRQWEDRWLGGVSPRRWKRWFVGVVRILWLAAATGVLAMTLRSTFLMMARGMSAFAKRHMQRISPDLFEPSRAAFQWLLAHPLIVLGLALATLWLSARWIARWPAIRCFRLSEKRGLVLALLSLLLMSGAYALDSRYYFGLYDRSLHLPLFVIQLALGLTGGALIYRSLGHGFRSRIAPILGGGILAAMVLTTVGFLRFDRDPSLKALFWSRSIVARRTVAFLQWAIDIDRDGFASILGGGDCDDTDPEIHPLVRETPNDGIDGNCLGGDPPSADRGSNGASRDANRLWRIRDSATGTGGNILLITIDALRADHLTGYGYDRPTSPHLDRFAGQGRCFLNAYSQGTNTGHSFASMLRSACGEAIFDNTRPTFIELLAQQGYSTAFFNAKRTERWLRGRTWKRYKPTLLRGIQYHAHEHGLGQWSVDVIVDEVIDTLHSATLSEPFFIWMHSLEPHSPYHAHPGFDFGERRVDRYDSEIAYTDRALGRLFEHLDRSETWRDTLVIVSSDHGEAFFEHGQQEHSSRPYQEQIRVPLLIRHPTAAPGTFHQPVGLIDLGPTILRFAGIDPPPDYEGTDLFSPVARIDRPIFSEMPRNVPEPSSYTWAMIDGSWKLMYDIVRHTFELYNLQDDPGEQRNLVNAAPHISAQMREKFGRWFDAQRLRPTHSGDWSLEHLLRK